MVHINGSLLTWVSLACCSSLADIAFFCSRNNATLMQTFKYRTLPPLLVYVPICSLHMNLPYLYVQRTWMNSARYQIRGRWQGPPSISTACSGSNWQWLVSMLVSYSVRLILTKSWKVHVYFWLAQMIDVCGKSEPVYNFSFNPHLREYLAATSADTVKVCPYYFDLLHSRAFHALHHTWGFALLSYRYFCLHLQKACLHVNCNVRMKHLLPNKRCWFFHVCSTLNKFFCPVGLRGWREFQWASRQWTEVIESAGRRGQQQWRDIQSVLRCAVWNQPLQLGVHMWLY